MTRLVFAVRYHYDVVKPILDYVRASKHIDERAFDAYFTAGTLLLDLLSDKPSVETIQTLFKHVRDSGKTTVVKEDIEAMYEAFVKSEEYKALKDYVQTTIDSFNLPSYTITDRHVDFPNGILIMDLKDAYSD